MNNGNRLKLLKFPRSYHSSSDFLIRLVINIVVFSYPYHNNSVDVTN